MAVTDGGKDGPPTGLESAKIQRQEFWLSTFSGTAKMQSTCRQVLELYRQHGCLFYEPTHNQVQDILDALDSAMPLWEKNHCELFFQALKLIFPGLVRRH